MTRRNVRKRMSFFTAINKLIWFILGEHNRRIVEAEIAERNAKNALDRLNVAEKRVELMAEQKQGVIKRYRQTDENRINAMLNQEKRNKEIKVLELKIKLLERELGINHDPFEAANYEPGETSPDS